MADIDRQILDQNPWWKDLDAIDSDPHIIALQAHPFSWDPPVENTISLQTGSVHILRGPRQTGKTTTAKRLIRTLLRNGNHRVLYFSFDLHTRPEIIADVIRRAKQLHPHPEGPWYLFLDEITSLVDWARGIKYVWDQGMIRDDMVLVTGSSAHGLKRGSEQLPGRRGRGKDLLHLPMSFRDFCLATSDITFPPETMRLNGIFESPGKELIRELNLHSAELNTAFREYLRVGGFPAAVSSWMVSGDYPAEITRTLWSIVANDVARSGRDQTSALKLLEEIGLSLGSFLKWSGAAKAMDVKKPDTAKEYALLLSESFMLLTVFFWDMSGKGFQPQKRRKVFYMDPLLAHVAPELIPGARSPDADAMRENAVAIGLYRSGVEALAQASPMPGCMGYWRSRDDREIDFVLPPEAGGERDRALAVESKGDNHALVSNARKAIRHVFGRGVVATRGLYAWDDDVPAIPASVMLAALEERPRRTAITI